ncbi:MAG TPA: peptide ABC transporter substrate-binding protein [Candidatus Bathyarchaeia archaeon]|nr:peptide ABC transporter substrate-binding protein [Candidatus Bathyarchaeia archaeon]
MNKKLVALLSTATIISSVLTGCGPQAAQPAAGDQQQQQADKASSPKVLRTNSTAEPPSLDPALITDTTGGTVARALFDGLTRTGLDEKPHESVAEKIDVSPDGLKYTFHLRDSKWSNGDPVTAHDFEFAWKRALDPKTASDYSYQLFYIKNAEKANNGEVGFDQVGVKALDDKTLEVTLENPTPFFLELTGFYTYYPVNKKLVESNPNWANEAATFVGNGPFTMETWEHKAKIVMKKNENYWDKDAVKLDGIEISMVEDENTELAMFENDELDLVGEPMGGVPLDAVKALQEAGTLQIKPTAGTYYYVFNTDKAPFNNIKIRKAFTYALDRKTITENVSQAGELPAMGFIPPTMAVHEGDYFKDNDVDQAKKLLDEGMKELGITKLPEITLMYNTSEGHKKIAEAVQDMWKRNLGVEVKIVNQEWKVFLETRDQGNFQIARAGWSGDFNDPINFLELFKEKNGGNNNTFWENKQFADLLTQSGKEQDPAKRKQLLAQAEKIFMDEMPVAPVYYYTDMWVQNPKVKDILHDSLSFQDFKWADITE